MGEVHNLSKYMEHSPSVMMGNDNINIQIYMHKLLYKYIYIYIHIYIYISYIYTNLHVISLVQVGEVQNLSKYMEYSPFVVMGNDKCKVTINRVPNIAKIFALKQVQVKF